MRAVGDDEVVPHRHAGEQLEALERAAEAEAGPLVDGQVADVLPGEADRALFGPEHAEQAVEERGLARAVGTDEADELALGHREVDAVRAR